MYYLKNMLNKKLLQIFICKIYAKLLETVCLKILKSEDVENTDCAFIRIPHVGLIDGVVDLLHNVNKQSAVDTLGEGVPDVL